MRAVEAHGHITRSSPPSYHERESTSVQGRRHCVHVQCGLLQNLSPPIVISQPFAQACTSHAKSGDVAANTRKPPLRNKDSDIPRTQLTKPTKVILERYVDMGPEPFGIMFKGWLPGYLYCGCNGMHFWTIYINVYMR